MALMHVHRSSKHRMRPFRVHILQEHHKLRALVSALLAALLMLLFSALWDVIVADIQYGLSIPLVELGLSSVATFASHTPWLGAVLALVSMILSVMFIRSNANAVLKAFGRYEVTFPDSYAAAFVFFFLIISPVIALTSVDTTIAQGDPFDRLRSFQNFVTDRVLVGVLVGVEQDSIIIRDSGGQLYILRIGEDAVNNLSVDFGDSIAVSLDESIDRPDEPTTEPIVVVVDPSKPIVENPRFEDPTPPPDDDPGDDSGPIVSPDPTPTPGPEPEPGPDPTPGPTDPTSEVLIVRALGDTGLEVIEVYADGISLGTANLDRVFGNYYFEYPDFTDSTDIRVQFTNDANDSDGDRNVRVDYIRVDGVQIETESANTYSTGTWAADSGCGPGFKQSEWLQCVGYLQYQAGTDSTPDPTPDPVPEPTPPIDSTPPIESSPGCYPTSINEVGWRGAGLSESQLTPMSGHITLGDGDVLENFDLDGYITVDGDNVIIRNGRLRASSGTPGWAGPILIYRGSNTLIEYVEIDGNGNGDNGIHTFANSALNYTLRYIDMHSVPADAIKGASGQSVIHKVFLHDRDPTKTSAHADSYQPISYRAGDQLTVTCSNFEWGVPDGYSVSDWNSDFNVTKISGGQGIWAVNPGTPSIDIRDSRIIAMGTILGLNSVDNLISLCNVELGSELGFGVTHPSSLTNESQATRAWSNVTNAYSGATIAAPFSTNSSC